MTRWKYTGPGPDVEPLSNAVIHPGDVWEFPEEPVFGRWEPLDEPEGSEKPSEALEPATPAETQASGENASTDASEPTSTKEA